MSRWLRMTLLGIGAMNSPRYRPAGLLVAWAGRRVMLDGGGAAVPPSRVDTWLVTDDRAELIADIRRHCRALNLAPRVGDWGAGVVTISALNVVHTSHPTVGYLIRAGGRRAVWAPEFWRFPAWAAGADLMFADAAGWHRPIHFAGSVGGHASVADTAERANQCGVRRLVFAHIGRPCIRARDAGLRPAFGEWGVEGRVHRLPFETAANDDPVAAAEPGSRPANAATFKRGDRGPGSLGPAIGRCRGRPSPR